MASLRSERLEYLQSHNILNNQDNVIEEETCAIEEPVVEEITHTVEEPVSASTIPDIICPLVQEHREEVVYPVQYFVYPEKFRIDDDDIDVDMMSKNDDFALIHGVIPKSPEGTIHPTLRLALREGAEENAPLIPGSYVLILYVFDREEAAKKMGNDATPGELKALGFNTTTLAEEVRDGGDFDFQHIQNLQGDEQLRALLQASQRENEEFELALAISMSSNYGIVECVEATEGTSSSVETTSSDSTETFETISHDDSNSSSESSEDFDYDGQWFVFDMRYMSIFLDMPFEERPFFISGKHKFSLIPEQWNTIKRRMDMIQSNPENARRYDEEYFNRYSSQLNL